MRKDIHPEYEETTITCACGNVINTRSTKKDIKVEVCSKCHPFYTCKQKLMDTGGRVDRFQKRFNLDYYSKNYKGWIIQSTLFVYMSTPSPLTYKAKTFT